ncbi:MAG: hypothetical protein ACRCUS_05920 [Anaerovoracaceae bacterium]
MLLVNTMCFGFMKSYYQKESINTTEYSKGMQKIEDELKKKFEEDDKEMYQTP